MSDIAIRVEHLSRRYRIGLRQHYEALRDTLTEAALRPFRAVRFTCERSNVLTC
jgi:hypothetical protein